MRNAQLHFMHDRLLVRGFESKSRYKIAGYEEFLGDVVEDVKTKVKGVSTFEGAMSFLAPAVLWSFGFRKFAIVFEIAKAFGFDFEHYLTMLRVTAAPIFKDLFDGKTVDASKIEETAQSAAENAYAHDPDPDKIKKVLDEHGDTITKTQSLNGIFKTKIALGRGTFDGMMLEDLFKARSYRGGITKAITKIFTVILTTLAIAMGFAIAGSTISRLFGHGKKSPNDNTQEQSVISETPEDKEPTTSVSKTSDPVLVLNSQADASLFSQTYNDDSHIWMMHFNIRDIKDHLIEWAKQLYPQLKDNSAFEASQHFGQTLKLFKDRNAGSSQLQMLAVPEPFKSIKDIVDSFALDVARHMQPKES